MSAELEDLNREAWRTGKPFITTEYGTFRAISPEMFREQRIMNDLHNQMLKILAFNTPPKERCEEFYFGWCIGEMK